ncbi:hypothetical protein CW362_25775 [Streptomyces populi]|uniref:Uncharacterized protein n=1 Tax=Streptomyces populi TaxID=2058924 RepID=A0A2I0SJV9_9ACTN|nr:hypothetical protein CW362_25775 [Streptomyces populi]
MAARAQEVAEAVPAADRDHLMPNSEARARAAVDRVFRDPESTGDGPDTAPIRPTGQVDPLSCIEVRTATTDLEQP